MRVLNSKAIALLAAAILILAACGGGTTAPTDPVGGVAAAFDIAKSGGALKQAELATCLATGGTGTFGDAFSGFFGGLGADELAQAGISQDDFLAAFKVSFDNLQTVEKSRSGDQATVHVSVKMTLSVDAGKMRDLLKRYGATQGIVPDDATIDAGILSRLGGTLTPSETIDNDITVVQQDGKWVACGSAFAAAGGGATGATGTPPTAGDATAPTQAAAATEAPTSGALTPAPTSTTTGSAGSTATGDAVAIAAGDFHTCAVLSDGSVMCWGFNPYGQLGNGTVTATTNDTPASPPAPVIGLTSGVRAISARGNYNCALTSGGGVKCWGSGAVGNGSSAPSSTPVDVVGLASGVTAIFAGDFHACAVTSGGAVKCWGRNGAGQLGNGLTTDSAAPVDVVGLTGAVTVVAGSTDRGLGYTCALTSRGAVKCWGGNDHGQLGNGSTTDSSSVVDVVGLASGVSAIAAGYGSSCALTSAGGVKCWGIDADGSTTTSAIPVDVAGLTSGVMAIAADRDETCALMSAGGVKCWGQNPSVSAAYSSLPVVASAIAFSGQVNFCALTSSGGVTCNFRFGKWADVTGLEASSTGGQTPSPSSAATGNTAAMSVGYQAICTLTSGGGVKCWGANPGNGSSGSNTPVDVVGLASGVSAISVGLGHTCAITTGGGVKCWGDNTQGQLGTGSKANSLIPVDVTGLTSGVKAVAAGSGYSCAVRSGGGVKCWGAGSLAPADVPGLTSGVSAIAVSNDHSCAITTGGGVKCWGGGYGATPVGVAGLTSGVTAIATEFDHTCVLTSGGRVKCWPESAGQKAAPVDVPGLSSGVTAIATGYNLDTCVLMSGGGVKCWGKNTNGGALGNGTTAGSTTPVDVAGLSSGITTIAAGGTHACAITSERAVKCWGDGFGTTPVDVPVP